jgi:hypothetical protein
LTLFSVLVLYIVIAGDAWIRRWQTVTYCTPQVGFTGYLRNGPPRDHAGQLSSCRAAAHPTSPTP